MSDIRRSAAVLVCALGLMSGCASTRRTEARTPASTTPQHEATTDLLAGRLRAWLPPGARADRRPSSIMGSPLSVQEDMAILLDDGDERFGIFVHELFATTGPDLLATVRAWKGTYPDERIDALPGTDAGLRGARVVQTRLEFMDDIAALQHAYVAFDDDTVVEVGFLVNRAAAAREDHYRALADAVVASLRPGPRRLARGQGPRALDEVLVATVPAGFVVTKRPGPDFDVYRLRWIRRLDETFGLVGVYVGHHPSTQRAQREGPVVDEPPVPGTLLGAPTTWMAWADGERTEPVHFLEATARLPGEGEAIVHVWVTTNDASLLGPLRAVAETLAVPTR